MDIQVIVNQMIILFLVMIIGYIANKSGILDQTQNQKMSSLVLNITSPGLILSSVRAPTNGSLSSVIQIFLISIAIYMVLTSCTRFIICNTQYSYSHRSILRYDCYDICNNTDIFLCNYKEKY